MNLTVIMKIPALLAVIVALSSHTIFAAAAKLNVLFIAVDDLRPELGCYGVKHIQSPNIDRLATRGLLFERAYCQVAVCNPSRNSLLSGCRADTTRVFNNQTFLHQTMPDVLTLPQHFKNNGYTSLSLGKIFHHSEREPGDVPQAWSEPAWYHGEPYRQWFTKESLDYVKQLKALPKDKQPKQLRAAPFEAADEPDDVYADGQTAAKAIETLRRLKAEEKPFFLGVGFVKPHLPFTCPRKYWDLYPAETIQLAANSFRPKDAPAPAFDDPYELRSYGTVPPDGDIPRGMALNLIRGYRACVSFVDAQVGRVLDELDRLGLRENTVVVFWGDHGYHLGENGHWTKMTNFELGARVPLIVSVPMQAATGQRTRALVELVDLYPTLAELCGLVLPAHLEGTSFTPLLDKPDLPWKIAAFSQYLRRGKEGFMGRSIRTDRWRYTEWTNAKNESGGIELYDEQNDPLETINTAGDASMQSIVAEMAKRLREGWKAALPGRNNNAGTLKPNIEISIASFDERTLEDWQVEGSAFQALPVRDREQQREARGGYVWSGKTGPAGQGQITSPEFKIERRYINHLVSGERDAPSKIGAELLIAGRVVRATSATESFGQTMEWRTWDVSEFGGKLARIRVNDRSATGAIAVDELAQSDTPCAAPADASALMHETFRPQFHFTAQTGWLNDANGLLHHQGQWHLFHQHRPPGSATVVWGHAVSDDLLYWRHQPTAIPGDGPDSSFSGSGAVDWENTSGLKRGDDPPILLAYTSMPSGDSGRSGTQCLAFSADGARTFEKFSGNPILRTPATRDRDPKIFFHKPAKAWFMMLALSRDNTDRDHATYGLFRSRDLKQWEMLQEIGPGAWYWECPDFFEMPLDGDAQRTKWILVKGSGDYIVGSFDGNRFTPETEPIRIHWHNCYYGAQSFSDASGGRRVQIGWMSTGDKAARPNAYPGMPFNQQMSFPRELTLRSTPEGPRLFRAPVAEIAKLYANTHDLGARDLPPGDNALAGIAPGLLDIECELDLGNASRLSLKCRSAELSYGVKSRKLRCLNADPTLMIKDRRLSLRILLDRTSIEAFANGGEVDVTGIYFPDMTDSTLSLTVEGGAARMHRLIVHQLRSIWDKNAN